MRDEAPRTVAVVIAEHTIRWMVVETLRDEGYEVESVLPHAEGAAAEIARLRPAALVLEVGTHGEHLALLDALRALPAMRFLPAVTLNANDQFRRMAQAFSHALPLPFDIPHLLHAVSEATTPAPRARS
jgi:CheY-like chemotaxis protein